MAFTVANTVVNLPFLFACAVFFSVICYWAIGLHGGATHFFKFLAFLFLALFAAESQAVLISALVPLFIAALALCAFMNGFWMCVQGYFIRVRTTKCDVGLSLTPTPGSFSASFLVLLVRKMLHYV